MKRNLIPLFEVSCLVVVLGTSACAPSHYSVISTSHPAHPDAPQAKQAMAKPFLATEFSRGLTNVFTNAASDGQHEHLHKTDGTAASHTHEESK